MTRTFAVDGNNDLYLADGLLAIVSDLAAVLQNCEHAAKTILGEMVLATDQGLPYFQAVWVGVPNLAAFEAAFRTQVLAVDGVTSIPNLSMSTAGGVLSYAATIETVYGTGVVNG